MMTRILSSLALVLALTAPAFAQTDIALGGLSADPSAPLEITADSFSVDQSTQSAVFDGNVVIGQGGLRIAAGRVEVTYDSASGDIAQLTASGGVTFVTETEAAEAAQAEYDLQTGLLTLTGNVLLTQGPSALSAERMVVNLTTNSAQMEGRVRTVFQQQGDN